MKYDELNDSKLSKALVYWKQKRGLRRMPQKADIEPGEIKGILASVQLTDVLENGTRFRYRLIGTAIVEAFGADVTGQYVGEVMSNSQDSFARQFYQTTCEQRCPVFARGKYLTPTKNGLVVNRLLLPLSDDDEAVNVIMGVLTFEYSGADKSEIGFGVEIDPTASYIEVIEDIESIFSD